MSWVSKKWKKVRGAVAGFALGGLPGAIIGGVLDHNMQKQQKLAEEAAEEQKRANEEQKAIAAAKGGDQVVDNTGETLSETDQNRKRRGYLSTLSSQNKNTLLGAAAYGGGKTRLGD